MKRTLLAAACAVALVVGLSACTPEEVAKDAIRKNFPEGQHTKAIAVAHCESRLQAGVVSGGGGNWGLFQINRQTWEPTVIAMGYSWDQMTDPYVNADVAREIYDQVGSWRPWRCA